MRACLLGVCLIVGLGGSAGVEAGKPRPKAARVEIDAGELEALRTAGTAVIAADARTAAAVDGAGVAATLDVCITRKGAVRSVKVVSSSGFARYDAAVKKAAKRWRFRAYKADGKAIAVCAHVAVTDRADADPDPEPDAEPDDAAPPATVRPDALEAQRISGDKEIVPDDATKRAIAASGKARVIVPVKLCVSAAGEVRTVTILKSSGFPAYDATIERAMAAWRYRPFTVDGKSTVVCTAITLIYVQKA
jgi:TonB family protein